MVPERPLIVIVGPTASGKTALAVEIAQRFNGEIIAADSRTIFRDMNIGTAKPTMAERQGIVHWGFDLVTPGERYSAAAFQHYATDAITDICARRKTPIIVGGTGLYVDGVVFDYAYPDDVPITVRERFDAMSTDSLYEYCEDHGVALPHNYKNRRHILHAIFQDGVQASRRSSPIDSAHIFGIATARDTLRQRISVRAEQMFADGVVEEAKLLGNKYGWESEGMKGNIYPLIRRYLTGELSKQEIVNQFTHRDWQLAKRQMTWFRRNPYIQWGAVNDIKARIEQLFNTE